MFDPSLESQIRSLLIIAYTPLREKRIRFSALSDHQILEERNRKIPSLADLPEEVASALAAETDVAYLSRVRKLNDPSLVDLLVERETEALVPLVAEHRERTGAKGPVTDEELHHVQIGRTFAQITHGRDQFGAALAVAQTPERKELLQRVYDTIVADLGDLESRRENLTSQTLQESSQNITERWSQLAEWIRERDA
jgi:hypothetical protein